MFPAFKELLSDNRTVFSPSSLVRNPSDLMNYSMICSGIILVSSFVYSDFYIREDVLLVSRLIFLQLHGAAIYFHYKAIYNINESYTSYSSKNEWGMSNIEKEQMRIETKRIIRILMIRAAFALLIHMKMFEPLSSIPLIICTNIGAVTVWETYVSGSHFDLKKPQQGSIPRSTSGRLM